MINDIYDTVLYNFDVFVFHIVFARFGLGGGRESCCEESASFVFKKFDIWIASVGLWLTKIHSSAYNNQSGALISTKYTTCFKRCVIVLHSSNTFQYHHHQQNKQKQTKTRSEVIDCLFVGSFFFRGRHQYLDGGWLF